MRSGFTRYTDVMLSVTTAPLSVEAVTSQVEASVRLRGEGCGAVASFVGLVRATHKGRVVKYLEYEAFDELAIKVFQQIQAEVAEQWAGAALGIVHRTGRLEVGEASVVVVAATAHRAEAFQVCRYAIERIKQIAPVWKHEFFEDGEAWVEGAVADPDDEAARARAREIACA
jgi:molybdopterin synthase catalytic subunit